MTAQDWIIEGHTGISSKTIWSHFMLNKEPKWPSTPYDPSDLLRCYWLLKIAPEWELRIGEIAERYPEWRGLVEHWSELKAMLEAAWPKSCASGEYEDEPNATALYKRMKELLA